MKEIIERILIKLEIDDLLNIGVISDDIIKQIGKEYSYKKLIKVKMGIIDDDSINQLKSALINDIWQEHKIGDEYHMDGKPDKWKIAYYPIFEDGKTNKKYQEPRALVEMPIEGGIDFREVPLRYLSKCVI
jgi:RNA-binding protein YhbY